MKKPLIIFGNSQLAELAYFYFSTDSEYEIKAFTVDSDYAKETTFLGLPLIPFDNIQQDFSPHTHSVFVALGYTQLNQLRKEKYFACKEKGYHHANYISSKAIVLCPQENIGDNCFILENTTLQPFCRMGNNVMLWSNSHIGHHSVIHDHCFLSAHVAVAGNVTIGSACFLGINSTLRNNITVGESCIIGGGCWVNTDVPSNSVISANPAKLRTIKSSELEKI